MKPRSHPPTPNAARRRRRIGAAAAAALVATSLAAGVATADDPEDLGNATDYGIEPSPSGTVVQEGALSGTPRVASAYFVQLAGKSVVEGASAQAVSAQQESFLQEAAALACAIICSVSGNFCPAATVLAVEKWGEICLIGCKDTQMSISAARRTCRRILTSS